MHSEERIREIGHHPVWLVFKEPLKNFWIVFQYLVRFEPIIVMFGWFEASPENFLGGLAGLGGFWLVWLVFWLVWVVSTFTAYVLQYPCHI